MTNKPINTEFPPEQYPYRIRNWWKYQHYTKRNPPWIKLHISILSSEDFVVLDDASKLLAVVCMLIASKHGGHIPASATPAYFKRVAYLDIMPNFKPLIMCGFLEETLADASLSQHSIASARPETETETETETDKKVLEVAPKRSLPQPRGTRLPNDWMPNQEGLNFSVVQIGDARTSEELDKFRDYWLAVPGGKGRKLDWDRTWKNWVRNSGKNGGYSRSKTEKEKYGELLQSLGSGTIRQDTLGILPKFDPD